MTTPSEITTSESKTERDQNRAQVELSLVIPCYNEVERIGHTLAEIFTELPTITTAAFEVIVVDDGSADDTSGLVTELAKRHGPALRLVNHERNRGKGAAVRTGASAARGDFILMADADGSTPITELPRLLQEIRNGAEIVIGSRAIDVKAVTLKTRLHRKLLGRIFNGVVNLLVLPGIHDTQCGFKLFTRRVVSELFPRLSVSHFGFDIELLMVARSHRFLVREIPVHWHHVPGSKVHLVRDSLRMLAMVFRLFLRETVSRAR